MEYALSNDSISIKVSTAGGSFTSIEAGGREYLWQGDPAVWSGQAPICFPICGGLRFLDVCRTQHRATRLAHRHDVGMIAKNRECMCGNGTCRYMQDKRC